MTEVCHRRSMLINSGLSFYRVCTSNYCTWILVYRTLKFNFQYIKYWLQCYCICLLYLFLMHKTFANWLTFTIRVHYLRTFILQVASIAKHCLICLILHFDSNWQIFSYKIITGYKYKQKTNKNSFITK